MPVPHYHESWDETVYGLGGTTWHIAGRDVDLAPGESIFIPAASFTASRTGRAQRLDACVS